MKARLDRVLKKLALEHTPHLIAQYKQMEGDQIAHIQWLARQLARYNVVVLAGKLKEMHNVDLYVQDWLRGFGQFNALLTSNLYPSFNQISASNGDTVENPHIVVLQLDVEPVSNALAGYVIPYLAWRQPQRPYSEPELRGLMDIILREELGVGNLQPDVFYRLQMEGVAILKQMLGVQMRYISVTTFDQPILSLLPKQPPQPPIMLPEEQKRQEREFTRELENVERQEVDTTPSEAMFNPIPMRHQSKDVTGQPNRAKKPFVPVPPLPRRDNK